MKNTNLSRIIAENVRLVEELQAMETKNLEQEAEIEALANTIYGLQKEVERLNEK